MIIPDWAADRVLFGPPKPPHPLADNQAIVNCHACSTPVLETVDEDGTPTYASLTGRAAVTPRELIRMLESWDQDETFEVHMQNNPLGGPMHPIILTQNSNAINLNGKD